MEAKKSVLIEDVEKVSIRFLDQKNEWQQEWPPLTTPPSTELPIAIEVILQLNDWGDIRRLYAIK